VKAREMRQLIEGVDCVRCGTRLASDAEFDQLESIKRGTQEYTAAVEALGLRCWSRFGSECPVPALDALALRDEVVSLRYEVERLQALLQGRACHGGA
jgi:hypothetical protein